MIDFAGERALMVENDLKRRGIRDHRVLVAMATVPRETFVSADQRAYAYADEPLSIGAGQTISQPYVVALMAEAARLGPHDRVLEIGTGSGYGAAVLSWLAEAVYSVERHAALLEIAADRLARCGYGNVQTRVGDGTLGWPEAAPFDAILVTAAGPVPDALKAQLKPGGRLVMPVGAPHGDQTLKRYTKTSDVSYVEDDLGAVMFVPLVAGAA